MYADEGLVAEMDSAGAVVKSYGWMPDGTWGTDPVLMAEGGQTYFYHNDHLGTPQKMTNAAGNVAWSATYTAFGEANIDSASTVTNNLRYPGQYYDSETGLHYNWFRYYDPKTGRYITADPIGLSGGLNLYSYVGGNPNTRHDYIGLAWYDIRESIEFWEDFAVSGMEEGGILGYTKGVIGTLMNTILEYFDVEATSNKIQIILNSDCTGGQRFSAATSCVFLAIMNVSGEGKVGKSVLKSTKLVKHHVIPREILRKLPKDLYKEVRGVKGAPNKWPIPKDLHDLIHCCDGRGGKYNKFWREELKSMEDLRDGLKNITPDDMFDIRNRAVDKFGLNKYKSY